MSKRPNAKTAFLCHKLVSDGGALARMCERDEES